MASTIFNRLYQTEMDQATTGTISNQTDPINNLVNQIMGSVNPQQAFNQVLATNPDAQNAMNLINQYGNGDPRAAFMNYMNSTGKQNLGQQLMQRFNLQ